MRITLTLPVILLAGALAAQGQEPMLISGDQAAYPVSVPVSTDAAPHAAAPQHLHWPAMPHFYGHGEWPGPRPCCPAPDGTVWGTCARPRSYAMHLWDDYCRESTKCPCCGYSLGSTMHYLKCEQHRGHTAGRGCRCRPCGCAGGGCASGGAMTTAGAHYQDATPAKTPTPMRDKPAPTPPPMMMDMMKDMGKKKDKMKEKKPVKPQGKKEKADPKVEAKTSALDGLPAFFAPLMNRSR